MDVERIVDRAQRRRAKALLHLSDGRRFHQDIERQLVLQLLLDAVEQVDGRERVAAEQEKIIIQADVLALERIAP